MFQPKFDRNLIVAMSIAGSALMPSPVMAEKATLIQPGQEAPDFTLPAQDGTSVNLKEFRGKKAVVLYFYPKDDKLVCKKEACLMRDKYSAFVDAGAEVLGVSSDSIKSHKNFVSQRNLPFRLLSDKGGEVRKLYGIPRAAGGLLPGRVTFVIDRQGTVRMTFKSLLDAEGHVSEALKVLKTIDSGKDG